MKIIKSLTSKDKKTVKYLQKTKDNNIIETGYYNLNEHIICISSQIGCPLGCIFCATGNPIDTLNPKKKFIRNLTSSEIVDQTKNVLDKIPKNKLNKKILFSFMGMGEPFLNYDNVLESIKILSKEFPNSRTTISTIGINLFLIRKLAREKLKTTLKLHLSLHAPKNKLRKKILPNTKKIKPSLKALNYFSLKQGVPVKVNYILIKGLNDSKRHAKQLALLLKKYDFTVKISNLNPFGGLESSDIKKFELFEKILNGRNIKTCRFISTGTDIEAGCGQLRRHFKKR